MAATIPLGVVLNNVLLTAAAATRTFYIKTQDYSDVMLQVSITWAAATNVTLTWSGSVDGGNNYGSMTSVNIGAGVGTVSAYTDVLATAASTTAEIPMRVAGYTDIRVVVSDGGGTATTDRVTVRASGFKGL